MMQVKIDAETADRIVVCALRDSIDCLKESIKNLKRKKKLEDYEKQDLADSIRSLDAMEEVYDYFGGNVK
jgi:hypothetical protein